MDIIPLENAQKDLSNIITSVSRDNRPVEIISPTETQNVVIVGKDDWHGMHCMKR